MTTDKVVDQCAELIAKMCVKDDKTRRQAAEELFYEMAPATVLHTNRISRITVALDIDLKRIRAVLDDIEQELADLSLAIDSRTRAEQDWYACRGLRANRE